MELTKTIQQFAENLTNESRLVEKEMNALRKENSALRRTIRAREIIERRTGRTTMAIGVANILASHNIKVAFITPFYNNRTGILSTLDKRVAIFTPNDILQKKHAGLVFERVIVDPTAFTIGSIDELNALSDFLADTEIRYQVFGYKKN